MTELVISDLVVEVDSNRVIDGLDLTINSGEIHALMGPNGTGKSSLSYALMGKRGYQVLGGTVTLDGKDVLAMSTSERGQAGLFLAMQYPTEVPGVDLAQLLSHAKGESVTEESLVTEANALGHDTALLSRGLNVDLSGGEQKRSEVIQMTQLEPKLAILDEIDSGLDVDSLSAVAKRISELAKDKGTSVLAITHYNRLLKELKPGFVHVLVGGKIVHSGGPEVAEKLEEFGYAAFAA